MSDQPDQPVVPGIVVDSSGEATVDSALANVLFDLAVNLEELTDLPVDVEHVLAAIVLAARNHQLDPNVPLDAGNSELVELLVPHVKIVFAVYGGQVGRDDE